VTLMRLSRNLVKWYRCTLARRRLWQSWQYCRKP